MRRLVLFALVLLPTLAFGQPQDLRNRGEWVTYSDATCIGGGRCPEKRLRIRLQDRPVVAVRFRAHDDIGEQAGGVLRVKIDTNTIRPYMDIARKGELYTVDVDELTGQYLIFEAATSDEVDIRDVAVLYSREGRGRIDDYRDRIDRDRGRGDRGRSGWRKYSESGCIGGAECRKNGTRITIALDDAPVLGVRFHAHDSIGTRADGKLTVRIDDTAVASYVDVARDGKRHEFDVDNLRGQRLVISTANDDEVEIRDVEVLYGSRRSSRDDDDYRGGGGPREIRHEGSCIGGDQCGGRRARIRIPLRDRAVASIRLYARDDVGERAGGELR
ncbi:MAG TPA: hypothetical protein VF111_06655, partial [Thermoanaerobaculia bacterium]